LTFKVSRDWSSPWSLDWDPELERGFELEFDSGACDAGAEDGEFWVPEFGTLELWPAEFALGELCAVETFEPNANAAKSSATANDLKLRDELFISFF
jgi:hypothetical protein